MQTLAVCRTCPRGQPEKGGMAERLRALLAGSRALADLQLLSVECLGGCPRPCAVAFDAPAKWRVRLTGLTAQHAADVIEAARAYARLPDGRLADADLPPALRGHISALSPKYASPPARSAGG